MGKDVFLNLTQYQLGIIATAIRERIYAANDGRVSLDSFEIEELQNLLGKLQEVSESNNDS